MRAEYCCKGNQFLKARAKANEITSCCTQVSQAVFRYIACIGQIMAMEPAEEEELLAVSYVVTLTTGMGL